MKKTNKCGRTPSLRRRWLTTRTTPISCRRWLYGFHWSRVPSAFPSSRIVSSGYLKRDSRSRQLRNLTFFIFRVSVSLARICDFPDPRSVPVNCSKLSFLFVLLSSFTVSAFAQTDDASTRQLAHDIFKQLVEINP